MESHKRVVIDFFHAISAGQFDHAASFLDPDGLWWTLQNRSGRTLPEQLARIQSMASDSKNGVVFKVKSIIAEGNRVAAELESFAQLPHIDYNQWYFVLFEIDPERLVITQLRMYLDTAYISQVLDGWVAPCDRPDASVSSSTLANQAGS